MERSLWIMGCLQADSLEFLPFGREGEDFFQKAREQFTRGKWIIYTNIP